MKMKNIITAASVGMILLLAACNMPEPTSAPMPTPTVAAPPPATGVEYTFVTNKLLLPTTQEQTQAFALNIDGDAQQTPDNKFGDLFTMLTSTIQNIELQPALDQAVNGGQLVLLHAVKADDAMNAPDVSWSIFLGQKTQSPPKFDGSDKFTLDSAMPAPTPIIGSLTNGHFAGGPGAAKVQIFLLGRTVEVNLIGVRLEADVSAQGCINGKLGGALTVEEFHDNILPPIVDELNLVVKADQTAANTLLPTFDSDSNGQITSQELESNPLFMIATAPDMDLLDASGAFNPGQDGVKDSYSVGLGFTCVPATWE
jgi:hypothetical protein